MTDLERYALKKIALNAQASHRQVAKLLEPAKALRSSIFPAAGLGVDTAKTLGRIADDLQHIARKLDDALKAEARARGEIVRDDPKPDGAA